eukprot:g5696.t1
MLRSLVLNSQFIFGSCRSLAAKTQEPYSAEYQLRNQSIDPNGPQFAYYLWSGNITREEFEKTMFYERPTITFKIKNGQLYQKRHPNKNNDFRKFFHHTLLLQFLITLYLHDVPDLDFTFFFRDEVTCGYPFFSNNANTDCKENAGFVIPSYGVFNRAFGRVQFEKYQRCLNWRYPINTAIPKAVWRGTTTGIPVFKVPDFYKRLRVQFVELTQQYPQLFDVGFVGFVQLEDEILKKLKKDVQLVNRMHFDDFNRFGVILDLDGNSWSDRFHSLLLSNRLILKQQSPYREYFRFEPQPKLATFFNRNFSNLVELTEIALNQLKTEEGRKSIEIEVENRRRFALEHVSQLSVIRATAYVLTIYSQKQTWDVQEETDEYFRIDSSTVIVPKDFTYPKPFVSAVMEYFKD